MKKITAHIISHSHWDREWYLGYEHQHMMLIDLIDDVLEKIETDKDFKSFHLDGQTLLLEDYLQLRPYNYDKLVNAVKSGKLKVGPWYILQDAFLTSSEANVRNMQIGQKIAKQFGGVTKVGYFPDTFGIYSQAAQILKLSNVDNMFFGRGVKPTGFANEVSDDFTSNYAEMFIKAPNDDSVLGILFANWYCNGMEIPTDTKLAKEYWENQLPRAQKYASTSQLLFMNGCDHQPLQKDVTKAIAVANELFEDVEFIHSTLEEYLEAVKKELKEENISTISGELRSQNTKGHGTLVNTLSSRVDQKIANFECQNLLEKVIEPLYVLTDVRYPEDKIEYAWKKLMQNHPHDSICGCSIDSVHKSMDARFIDVKELGTYLIREVRDSLVPDKRQNQKRQIVLINTLPIEKRFHNVQITWDKKYFSEVEKPVEAKSYIDNVKINNVKLSDGELFIEGIRTTFDFDLPKDRFRQPYYAKTISAIVDLPLKAFETRVIEILESTDDCKQSIPNPSSSKISNSYYEIEVGKDGITINNQACHIKLIDEGDVGNEYMFGETVDNDYNVKHFEVTSNVKNDIYSEVTCKYVYSLPSSAEEFYDKRLSLDKHYRMQVRRGTEFVDTDAVVKIRLYKDSKNIELNYSVDNKSKDHRMRLFFDYKTNQDHIHVDSCFELLKRPIETSSVWENKYNDQPLQKFVHLQGENDSLVVATKGLHEYEYRDGLYITLFRSVSQLGDWGVFETPDAQCLKNMEFSFVLSLYNEDIIEKYKEYSNQFVDTISFDLFSSTLNESTLEINLPKEMNVTALYKNDCETYLRGYNLTDENIIAHELESFDLLGNALATINEIKPSQIVTTKINQSTLSQREQ